MYEKLAAKVNNIDTRDFVLKTKYQTDKTELEKKIYDLSDFVKKKNSLNQKKNRDVSSLATKTALTAVENKISSVSSLVKNTEYDTKISELEKNLTDHIHEKYITTSQLNNLVASVFNVRLAQRSLIAKTDFNAKLSSLNRKIIENNTKQLLVEIELKKLKTFDSSQFIGKSHFEEHDTQNYLVFQPVNRYFKVITNAKCFIMEI